MKADVIWQQCRNPAEGSENTTQNCLNENIYGPAWTAETLWDGFSFKAWWISHADVFLKIELIVLMRSNDSLQRFAGQFLHLVCVMNKHIHLMILSVKAMSITTVHSHKLDICPVKIHRFWPYTSFDAVRALGSALYRSKRCIFLINILQ